MGVLLSRWTHQLLLVSAGSGIIIAVSLVNFHLVFWWYLFWWHHLAPQPLAPTPLSRPSTRFPPHRLEHSCLHSEGA